MGRALSKKASKAEYYHTWHESETGKFWFIRDYHTGYLSISKYEKGEQDPVTKYVFEKTTYKPLAQGYRLNQSFDRTCDDHPIYYTSLEDAQKAVMERWDYFRIHTNEVLMDQKAGGNKRTLLVQKNKEIMKSGKAKLYG